MQYSACCVLGLPLPPVSRLRQVGWDPRHIPTPYSPCWHRSALEEGAGDWLNERTHWTCINGPFHTLRNLRPFFFLYLFSAWCSLSPCTYFWSGRDAYTYSVFHGKKERKVIIHCRPTVLIRQLYHPSVSYYWLGNVGSKPQKTPT